MSTCGASVQASFAPGRSASPVSPPAISTDPAIASDRVPARTPRNTRPAARAATGTAVTATAATAGERPQPSTSSSTSRNSAAVSAADSSASARLASTCGRSGEVSRFAWRRTTRPRSAIAAGSASSTTGICTTKIARHENAHVRSPPITGPSAAPATPAAAHRRTPARSAPVASTEQLEASHDHQRAAGRLGRPRRDQHTQRRRHRAHGRRGREADHATGGRHGRIPAHAHARRRNRHQREHEVERDQNPRDLPNLSPEVAQDLRQRQRHHARVAKHHGDGERQHRDGSGACRQRTCRLVAAIRTHQKDLAHKMPGGRRVRDPRIATREVASGSAGGFASCLRSADPDPREPTINGEQCAGSRRRQWAGEVRDGMAGFLGGHQPADRLACAEGPLGLAGVLGLVE